VNGKKFAGISQRRLRQGVAVQIYLCADGSGSKRAEVVRDFYEAALNGEPTTFAYPAVQPEVMASLEELSGQALSVQDLMLTFYKTLGRFGELVPSQLTIEEVKRFEEAYQRVIERNEKTFA
jgi:octanoyl-[GcvH]:protein N-octanoyltransferase